MADFDPAKNRDTEDPIKWFRKSKMVLLHMFDIRRTQKITLNEIYREAQMLTGR